ncbi:MAG: ferrous iron transport protein B [Candidatus Aenigmarchaeota archaeon]|nr:ferrous iron transport protein B [Candidatus Aenigmarchaeota archaeon]
MVKACFSCHGNTSCKDCGGAKLGGKNKKLRIALAGNANVGKSVMFNYLTKLHQHIGNWPGKTVEKAEGTFHFKGHEIDVIDLPGIYSLSTYSIEETVTREYIVEEKPDVVINVIDASVLERNLFLTLQLIELNVPMVIVLNQIDIAEKKGITINSKKLKKLLGVPVVPTVAVKGIGVYEAIEEAIGAIKKNKTPKKISYGKEIEKAIKNVEKHIPKSNGYPSRWTAIKLLENDKEIFKVSSSKVLSEVKKVSKGIEKLHTHSCPTAMSCEKYAVIGNIAKTVQESVKKDVSTADKFQDILTHKIWGYPIMLGAIFAIFLSLFSFGDFVAGVLDTLLMSFVGLVSSALGDNIFSGMITSLFEGIVAAITVVIPYILPFYLIFGILEDSGYMARMAFLMDNVMHKIGLHGKAFIPMMMGFGCNVPACLGCRVMETHRERLISVFVATLVPCAAVTAVVLGLVARYVSIWWAIGLYAIDIAIIFILGKIAFHALPGESTGLIMEIPSMRVPQFRTTVKQAWFRMKDFVYIAFPIIIASTVVINMMQFSGMLGPISNIMSPITVAWLGLPAVVGIAFIFGILRKELTLVMLVTLFGTTNLAAAMTQTQMLVFTLVTMLYIPCAATIAALVREIGWKKASFITVFEIVFAIVMGGIFLRILLMFF